MDAADAAAYAARAARAAARAVRASYAADAAVYAADAVYAAAHTAPDKAEQERIMRDIVMHYIEKGG